MKYIIKCLSGVLVALLIISTSNIQAIAFTEVDGSVSNISIPTNPIKQTPEEASTSTISDISSTITEEISTPTPPTLEDSDNLSEDATSTPSEVLDEDTSTKELEYSTTTPINKSRKEDFKKNNISKKSYVDGEILVKYKNEKIDLKTTSGRSAAANILSSKSLKKKEDLVGNNISVLKIRDSKTVEQKITELLNDPNVEFAEPNYMRYPTAISTNDTFRDRLWGLDNTGQLVDGVSGTNDADIDIPEAWVLSDATSTSNVIVAVIDTGVAYNHPDLVGNMWDGTSCKNENGAALGGCSYGYDFEDGDKIPLPTSSAHGTHVAGIIASSRNNNKGIIGVAPLAKIMAIKSSFSVSDTVKSIDFAIQNGAKIINASFAGEGFSQLEYDAINRFRTAGGLFVAAAGNESTNNESNHIYPSDYNLDNIISVAATDQNDGLSSFSNYGVTSVDVGAPGTNIYSLVNNTDVSLENFDSAAEPSLPAGWTSNGNWGTYEAAVGDNVLYADLNTPYVNNASSTAFSPSYNLSGNHTISFYAVCDTEYSSPDTHDYMALNFDSGTSTVEGFRWNETTLDDLNGNSSSAGSAVYYFDGYPMTNISSTFRYGFKWYTNSSNSPVSAYDGCLVDEIQLTRLSDGSDELYGFSDGTSMAAPHVAGLTALIMGYSPNLSISQVKNVILTTGDSVGALSGKTTTGKRINAYNALSTINAKAITAFTIPTQVGTTTINELTHTITLNVPYGTNLTSLTPSITMSGASLSPASGAANNFTATTTYTVTALNNSTEVYSVKVNLNPPSTDTVVNSTAYTVSTTSSTIINVPFGTASSTFISALTKNESHQTWNIGDVSNPVLSNDTLVVTAEDGTTIATYTITVNPPSSNAKLQNITLSKGSLSPNFSSTTFAYTASVKNSSITVTPTQALYQSIIKVNGATTTSGTPVSISLAVGANTISIDVLAEDALATSTYAIVVTRAASSGGGGGGGAPKKKVVVATSTPSSLINTIPANFNTLPKEQKRQILITILLDLLQQLLALKQKGL